MPPLLLETTTTTSIAIHQSYDKDDGTIVDKNYKNLGYTLTVEISGGQLVRVDLIQDNPPQSDESDLEFRRQKDAFLSIPPLLRSPYQGQYVVSRNGEIVDSDFDLLELSRRFFGAHGDVPVYIAKVDGEEIEYLDSPIYL